VLSSAEYLDIINFDDFPYIENKHRENIYHCFREPPLLTVIIGAKCSDGIVLIADKKVSAISGRDIRFEQKIYGDLAHILIGYAGRVSMFDIFRKYIVGDVVIRRSIEPYTPENFIEESSKSVKRFNDIIHEQDSLFEVLIVKHHWKNSELHYIDFEGIPKEVKCYMSIGSGAETADKFLANLKYDEITMQDFTKRAFFAIAFMDQHHPELRVGVGQGGIPLIKYMSYTEEWDVELKETHPFIEECRNYANQRMVKWKESFDEILKE
jgi:20S proteasome alpha/beta subunit